MSKTVNGCFDDKKAYARMNYLIDIIRGNVPFYRWKELSKETRDMYLEETDVAEYIITENDMKDIEDYIVQLRGETNE